MAPVALAAMARSDLVSRWRLVDGDACGGGNGLAIGSLGWRPRWQQSPIGARFG